MVRSYSGEPVDPAVVDRALANATRAPSAGFSQGWGFLVLDRPDDVRRFWAATTDAEEEPDRWLRGMSRAPVVVIPCSSKAAYLDRYAEDDKGWTDRDESRWPVPYWDTDVAMAAMVLLLGAIDAGLGALFFGVPAGRHDAVRGALDVPADRRVVGVVALGTEAERVSGSARTRRRRPLAEVLHEGRFGVSPKAPPPGL